MGDDPPKVTPSLPPNNRESSAGNSKEQPLLLRGNSVSSVLANVAIDCWSSNSLKPLNNTLKQGLETAQKYISAIGIAGDLKGAKLAVGEGNLANSDLRTKAKNDGGKLIGKNYSQLGEDFIGQAQVDLPRKSRQ